MSSSLTSLRVSIDDPHFPISVMVAHFSMLTSLQILATRTISTDVSDSELLSTISYNKSLAKLRNLRRLELDGIAMLADTLFEILSLNPIESLELTLYWYSCMCSSDPSDREFDDLMVMSAISGGTSLEWLRLKDKENCLSLLVGLKFSKLQRLRFLDLEMEVETNLLPLLIESLPVLKTLYVSCIVHELTLGVHLLKPIPLVGLALGLPKDFANMNSTLEILAKWVTSLSDLVVLQFPSIHILEPRIFNRRSWPCLQTLFIQSFFGEPHATSFSQLSSLATFQIFTICCENLEDDSIGALVSCIDQLHSVQQLRKMHFSLSGVLESDRSFWTAVTALRFALPCCDV
eukprot:CAMPEP_0184366168 /NCGR_PEP_ID=MMETSP1089-20130417/152437_1 /TAXON_ID=38269 ORGANISM="Gloeochaete wittrockiana, Strain SAG46.84" /NCGR_SAMPLE_ID=MMETSP1089 /ASSEMBLY_ACC=CAM_ASM_000445 /LENGTH=346 /DNA_ID=CAMNT_0026707659 /DNA_START=432 /DNA_END=1469 /DNA_ORIENTATION=-